MAIGREVWSPFDVVTHTKLNNVSDRGRMRFANAAGRTAAIPTPELGMETTLDTSPNDVFYWNGSAWTARTYTSPAGTTPSLTPYAPTATCNVPAGTVPGGTGSWTTIGTVPVGATHLAGVTGINCSVVGAAVVELSLNGGTTVIARIPVSGVSRTVRLLPRAVTAGATISARAVSMSNNGAASVIAIGSILFCHATPSIVTTAVEQVLYITSGAAGWLNLGAVSAGRLVGVLDAQGLVSKIGVGSAALWDIAEGHVAGPIGLGAGTLQVNVTGALSANFGTGAVVLAA